jgi:hypothetical protein
MGLEEYACNLFIFKSFAHASSLEEPSRIGIRDGEDINKELIQWLSRRCILFRYSSQT